MRILQNIWAFLKRQALPLLTLIAVPLGFLFLEYPSNGDLWMMDQAYLVPNLILVVAFFLVCYGSGQRTRASVIVYLAVCLVVGLANFYVVSFKGQPITPADVAAISTALAVSGGYDYTPNMRSVLCIALFVAMCVGLVRVPREVTREGSLTRRVAFRTANVALNVGVAVVVTAGLVSWYQDNEIGEEYDISIDAWSAKESYVEQGMALCFLERLQELSPQEPEGYEHGAVLNMLSADLSRADYDGEAPSSAGEALELPTVIVVMNESFSDLSRYPGMQESAAKPAAFAQLSSESLVSGVAYVSALGGGTCNSEFEFLTGSSMGHMGGGVYPYMLYDLGYAESLVSYFKGLGYNAHAIHPESASNWGRSRVYGRLGFDDFSDKTQFVDADTLRGVTTDRATYDYILELLAADDAPQFIFDVTIQNHGGYETGAVPDELQVPVSLGDASLDAQLTEYVSCIQQSDADLAYLVDRLREYDRPIVLCFFGDHQPGFADELFKQTHDGVDVDFMGIEGAQERYEVPYLIWANDAARATLEAGELSVVPTNRTTSLNFLGGQLCQAVGLPLSNYQRFLLATSQTIPAINLNGYSDSQGEWHGYGWEADQALLDALQAYSFVQYDNLFNEELFDPTGGLLS